MLVALGVCLACAASVSAQTNERIYEALDFRFVTPGARAVGMGKTFIGLADDATAANSNPAGLSNLLEQEVSFEFNWTKNQHYRLTSLTPGEPSATRPFGQTVAVPAFVGYAIPVRRFTVLLFRNVAQEYKEQFAFEGRPLPFAPSSEDGAFGHVDIAAANYGVGLSYVVNRRLAVGGAVVITALNVASQGRSGTPLNPRNGTDTADSGVGWTGVGGVLFKVSPRLSLGAAYHGGARFSLETTLFGLFLEQGADRDMTGVKRRVDYVIPDRYSLGASWRVRSRLTVLADVARVRYSRLVTPNFLVVDFMDSAAGLSYRNFYVDDVTEVHAGVEYRVYAASTTWAFRGGAFTDPDHQMHYRRAGNNLEHVADRFLDFRFNSVKPRTDVGGTLGVGVAVRNRVQVDAAFSLSRKAREVVVSAVVKLR